MKSDGPNRHSGNRLKWFLALVVAGSIAIPALSIVIWEIRYQFGQQITNESSAKASELLTVLERGLNPQLWAFIPENAEYLIQGVALNEGVKKIVVTDSLGDLFSQYLQEDYAPEDDAIILKQDVMRDEIVIGAIELEYSLNPARSTAMASVTKMLTATFFQAFISVGIILLILNRRVTTPLQQLKAIAHEVADRNFDIPIETPYNDEFSDLALELDMMRQALKESFTTLEERVKQRTEALTKVNNELTDTVARLESAKDSLVETEKLAALGSLVAGVSHELNTPIGNARVMTSSLNESASQLQKKFETGEMTRSYFEQSLDEILTGSSLIERNLVKAINLVQSFKQIAVDRTSDKRRSFMLNEFLLEIESTMRHIFRSRPFELELKLSEDLEMNSYPGVLSQVVSNLINNALMHGFDGRNSGTITLSTSIVNNRVRIRVTDNGVGMTEEVKRRILEPFFTTKMGKGGSGLGMHIVHNLTVGTLGGKLEIHSTVNKGSSVDVIIPLIAPETLEFQEADS